MNKIVTCVAATRVVTKFYQEENRCTTLVLDKNRKVINRYESRATSFEMAKEEHDRIWKELKR